jgi:hypothetical protein
MVPALDVVRGSEDVRTGIPQLRTFEGTEV